MERGEATVASDIHALGVLADTCFGGNPPRAWKRIIERATSSIPARRYRDTASLMRAIRARHRAFRLLAAFFAVAVAAIAAVAVWQYGKAAERDALDEKQRLEESIQKEHEEILEMLQRDVY